MIQHTIYIITDVFTEPTCNFFKFFMYFYNIILSTCTYTCIHTCMYMYTVQGKLRIWQIWPIIFPIQFFALSALAIRIVKVNMQRSSIVTSRMNITDVRLLHR